MAIRRGTSVAISRQSTSVRIWQQTSPGADVSHTSHKQWTHNCKAMRNHETTSGKHHYHDIPVHPRMLFKTLCCDYSFNSVT